MVLLFDRALYARSLPRWSPPVLTDRHEVEGWTHRHADLGELGWRDRLRMRAAGPLVRRLESGVVDRCHGSGHLRGGGRPAPDALRAAGNRGRPLRHTCARSLGAPRPLAGGRLSRVSRLRSERRRRAPLRAGGLGSEAARRPPRAGRPQPNAGGACAGRTLRRGGAGGRRELRRVLFDGFSPRCRSASARSGAAVPA